MKIEYIERVLVAVRDLEASRESWRRAGFGVAPGTFEGGGLRLARLAAGAVEIDLCAAAHAEVAGPLSDYVREAAERGGGIIGWIWAASDRGDAAVSSSDSIAMPGLHESSVEAGLLPRSMPAVITAVTEARLDLESRAQRLRAICGANSNTVDYLEHIVVMTLVLEDAIAANEAAGVPCKRIREAGNGVRQAFFKLEQTVIEVVAPTRSRPGGWGVALMCGDIARAVAVARDHGFEATSPKQAIQGGQIARLIEPLDGIALAYMEPGVRIDD